MSTHDLRDQPTLRANLDALAERDSPVSAIDIRAARRAGDRLKKRRTTGRIGAVTAVVAAGALCFTVLPAELHGSGGTGVSPAEPGVTTPDKLAIPLVPGQDPVHQSGSFGWLPPGFSQEPEMSVADQNLIMVAQEPSATGSSTSPIGNIAVSVQLTPGPHTAAWSIKTPIQRGYLPVDGRPATFWIGLNPLDLCQSSTADEPDPASATTMSGLVTWTTAVGGAAELDACFPQGTAEPDANEMTIHVARMLSFSDAAVPLPFYLQDIPPNMRVQMWDGPTTAPKYDDWNFTMDIGPSKNKGFELRVAPLASSIAHTQTPDGLCKDETGLQICVYSILGTDPLPASLAKVGFTGLLDDVVGLGADPAHWTTNVVRYTGGPAGTR